MAYVSPLASCGVIGSARVGSVDSSSPVRRRLAQTGPLRQSLAVAKSGARFPHEANRRALRLLRIDLPYRDTSLRSGSPRSEAPGFVFGSWSVEAEYSLSEISAASRANLVPSNSAFADSTVSLWLAMISSGETRASMPDMARVPRLRSEPCKSLSTLRLSVTNWAVV
jgi:hypothetical protein